MLGSAQITRGDAQGKSRVHRVWRLGPRAGVLAVALVAAFAVADAVAATVPVPRVSAQTETMRFRGSPTIVVRSLLVSRIHGRLTVSCHRGCRRLLGPHGEQRQSKTSKRFWGVNWILRAGRVVKVTVTRRGRLGRFLLLSAKRRNGRLRLVFKRSGCLNRHRKRIRCPRGRSQPPGRVVPTPTTAPPNPPFPWQPPESGGGPSAFHCGGAVTVAGAGNPARGIANGNAVIRACLKYFRNPSGTYYYQGVLQVSYHESWVGASDLFSGKAMAARSGVAAASAVGDCPTGMWTNGDVLWCYSSPTTTFRGAGAKLYGKGVLIDYRGGWHPVWSPTITTY